MNGARTPARARRDARGRPPAALAALAAGALAALACSDSPTPDLPPADPGIAEPRGISRLATAALDGYLAANAALGRHAGYVALFARDGHLVHATTAGSADREADAPMRIDTRFRMASMTKPVTAVAALVLIEEGRLALDTPVADLVPAAGRLRVATSHEAGPGGAVPTAPLETPLTVRHLLEFRSGIGSGDDASDLGALWKARDLYAGTGPLSERVDRILGAPLYEEPGTTWRYGWSADVLARVVEVAADTPFDAFLRARIFEPLGMAATGFLPAEDAREDLARMYTRDEHGDLVPVETPASDAPDWTPGGSGLVSTAGDWMRFALMLWNGGRYAGARILSEETVAAMTRAHVRSGVLVEEGIEGLGWGLGLAVVVDADATPMVDRDGDFWWSGYYGTTFFVSPTTGLAGVVLTQDQPSDFSGRPYPIYLSQAFALFGT